MCKMIEVPRRSRPALLLKHTPLTLVLAQVRFSPILTMEQFVPAFQERIRGSGFPRFDTQQLRSVEVGAEVVDRKETRWLFRNKQLSSSVVLGNGSLVLETNNYSTFELFLESLTFVLKEFWEVARPDLVERVGLRYVDLIELPEGEDLGVYLKPGLLGLSTQELGVDRHLYRFEAVGESVGGDRLMAKVLQFNDGSFLPPDLRQHTLRYEKTPPSGATVTLLDIDNFRVGALDYEVPRIVEVLWDLHETTDLVFRNAVTDEALKRWGGGG